jgi:predicted DNA-binding protein YlxM (UPF0122 family)
MVKDKEVKPSEGRSLPRSFTSDLRGKQSVRATFRLTEGCIDAISIVATQLGIKQKSLFDHLAEDVRSLQSIARAMEKKAIPKDNRIQKTYVISRKSLYSLDEIAKTFNAPRDALVEISVQKLIPIIAKEQKKHDKRKQILAEIEAHYKKGEEILNKIKSFSGDDDPIYTKFSTAMTVYANAKDHIDSFIEKSKMIEEFDIENR